MSHDVEPESVDLIYLDPPFYTGQVQRGEKKWEPGSMEISYDDSKRFWAEKGLADKAPEWMKYIAAKNKERAAFAAYLYYMMERLELCKKALKPTGSIYLHCDEKASHYLKMVMDEVFGYDSYKNEIIWCYKGGNATNKFRKKHDTIFLYTKTDSYTFNADSTRIPYSSKILDMAQRDDSGKLYYKTGQNPSGKIYLHPEGQLPYDWWDDIPSGTMVHGKDMTGYPTQKPIRLLERIILASSNEGDTVLDPFCGCGTTIIAAQKLNRFWIGIDLNREAYDALEKRFMQLPLISIINPAYAEHRIVSRDLEEVKSLNANEFEKWVNEYYGATHPSPDRGVDGITKNGIPIQTKTWTYKVDDSLVRQFYSDIQMHPKVPQPVKQATIVSQFGFTDNARAMAFQIKAKFGVEIELKIPEDLLKIEEVSVGI